MIFDKNQTTFPSEYQKGVWWWGVGIVPLEVSLTDEVKRQCTPEELEGCHQWHACFSELAAEMYNRPEGFEPASARQIRDIFEYLCIHCELIGDDLVMTEEDFCKHEQKLNKSKGYASIGVDFRSCLNVLCDTGFAFEVKEGSVHFYHAIYPKIFHAMSLFEQSPNARKTPARHHFAHCEFRQLFKSFAGNYAELLRPVSDESLYVAGEIDVYAKSLKIQRYVHFDTIKYKHKGMRVLDYSIRGDIFPTMRANICTEGTEKIGVQPYRENLVEICEMIAARKRYIDEVSE